VEITIDKACCKGCGICLKACPKSVFGKSRKRNNYGTAMPEVKNAEKCMACGACERLCPDGAINVERKAKE
jgi:2-oxoglutarate ferredoxin oxidoreductase subunit delta